MNPCLTAAFYFNVKAMANGGDVCGKKRRLLREYGQAVASFVELVKKDERIDAIIVFGSVARGDIWDKSDVDIWLIGRGVLTFKRYSLIVCDLEFEVELYDVDQFFRLFEMQTTECFY